MQTEIASTKDIPELLDLLHDVFCAETPGHPRFETLYPHLFVETDEAAQRHLIIRQNGRIVSCVGSYPMILDVADCQVSIAGIGQVSTAPSMTGRGCMSQLLIDSIARMEREDIAISWLGGRHDRYARFGWETVAGDVNYTFVGSASRKRDETLLVSQANPHDKVIDDAMFSMRKRATTVMDSQENYQMRLGRGDSEIWISHTHKSEEPVAWAVVYPKTKQIADCCGSVDGVVEIVKSAATRLGSVHIGVCTADQALGERLRMECTDMAFGANSLLVVSLKKVLEDYAPLIERRTPSGFGVTLRMQLPNGSFEEAFVGKGGKVVELDRKRMARLLFGTERANAIPGVPESLFELNAIFPLPFTLPELFHV